MSHYIYFNSNPITDPLFTLYDSIKYEFYELLRFEGHLAKNEQDLIDWDIIHGKKINAVMSGTDNKILYSGKLKSMPLYLRDTLTDESEKEGLGWKENETERLWNTRLRIMPVLNAWFRTNKETIGQITFNVMAPGATLTHHWGLDRRYIRMHLCLKADPACVFDIQGERHAWIEKELFGFDDGNVFHGTAHRGNDYRIIMMIDVLKDIIEPYAKTWPVNMAWSDWDGRKNRPPRNEWPESPNWKDLEDYVNWKG